VAGRDTILALGRGALARDVVRTLAARSEDRRVVLATATRETSSGERTFDPESPSASRVLADLLLELRPRTVALLACSESPVSPPEPWRFDENLADVVVSALDRALELGAPAPDLLLLSHTAVYGVASSSPLVFDERSALPRETVFASASGRWAETLRAVERRIVVWAVSTGVRVGVLRTASVLGGPFDSPMAAMLRAAFPVRVLGYDPPCQAIHYDDLVEAVALAVEQGVGEVLNLVGREVVPLSRLLAMAGVFAPALPGVVADRLAPAAMDGAHLRWRTLADGRRATALLGFQPQRTLEDCLRD
jgi:nucleoside-diphosphate-sugar epimerase